MADSRFMMNVKGIAKSFIPRKIYQNQLQNILKEILKLKNIDNIITRLNYYNLQNDFFDIKKFENYEKIGKFPFKKTSYAYDAYAISKYFDDDFLWVKGFGDISYNLKYPSIAKSRPVENGFNNIILKLDKNRHFDFIQDKNQFEDKKDLLFFRGAIYQPHRIKFFEKYFDNPRCDIAHVGGRKIQAEKWIKNLNFKISRAYQTQFKFLLSLEGNDVASNLKWAMKTNSLVLAPKMRYETWFMEGKLVPNEHFALIDDDYENVEALLDYYLTNPHRAKEIIQNAHAYIEQFLDEKIEFYIGILVLAKYFYYSNQLDLPKDIVDLFD
ncbi:glycosyl transferase family 90 [Campylobacter sp. LMG 7929]|uniref:Lipopolysaccharide biosynthesis protein n=1 Tax=Campylobacter lari TaxID=201 RepID=A0A7M1MFS8_CAMLA|nr:lipopolysaccharide biosynthesis protein [Campylobacter lari]MCR8698307.1 glycosyl transferase family 90 [Campylobacter sp. LMG 7929]QOQ99580.1 lipopolysaccharide biosynthesis protein [Campylobacter lari]